MIFEQQARIANHDVVTTVTTLLRLRVRVGPGGLVKVRRTGTVAAAGAETESPRPSS